MRNSTKHNIHLGKNSFKDYYLILFASKIYQRGQNHFLSLKQRTTAQNFSFPLFCYHELSRQLNINFFITYILYQLIQISKLSISIFFSFHFFFLNFFNCQHPNKQISKRRNTGNSSTLAISSSKPSEMPRKSFPGSL